MEIEENSDIQRILWGNKKENPLDVYIYKPFL